MSKSKRILTVILAVAICFLSFGVGYLTRSVGVKNYSELEWALTMIKDNYYELDEDGNPIDFTADDYLSVISKHLLDPYSEYMSASSYGDYVSSSQGNAYGIGVKVFTAKLNEKVQIATVSGNSPFDRVCFERNVDPSGKILTHVSDLDGQNKVEVENFYDMSSKLQRYDAHVKFKVYLEGYEEGFIVSREAYVESYVEYYDNEKAFVFRSENYSGYPTGVSVDKAHAELDDKTCVITFTDFNGDAASQMEEALQYMKSRGKTKIILDLRNNGGGFLSILTDVASYLIDNNGNGNVLIAEAKYANGKTEDYHTGRNRYVGYDKLTVIANENSASATECLIGALLHYGQLSQENLIVTNYNSVDTVNGNKTYGKGIMQRTFTNVKTGSAIKLTVAYVYWPDKTTNIHKKGIKANPLNSTSYQDGLSRAIEINNAD